MPDPPTRPPVSYTREMARSRPSTDRLRLAAAALLAVCSLAAPTTASPPSGPSGLAPLVDELARRPGVITVAVWRHGELLEASGPIDRPHDIKSASKSVLSALVGIALERELLPGLDATVADLVPERAIELSPAKRAITLRDLLTMRSGLASTSGEHYGAWVSHRDWVAAALARPLTVDPGTEFTYSTGNSHIVGAALERAVGEDLFAWGRRVLFEPAGIEVHGWMTAPEGVRFGGNAFCITPRDLGRFGSLYAAGGEWRGERLVPADWIRESTTAHAEGWPDRYGRFGYLWWIPPGAPPGAFSAVGFGGQFCYVVPRSGIVVVVTSTHHSKGEEWDREVLALLGERLLQGPRR